MDPSSKLINYMPFVDLIKGSGRATIILPKGTIFQIEDALYPNKSSRNLLSFKDIHQNGYHIATMKHDENEYLLITSGQKCILEQLPFFILWVISDNY